jgi:hypothetical protein
MELRTSIPRLTVVAIASALVLGTIPTLALAHLGESSHLHVPGNTTTPVSSVWCVAFTEDPGAWRPEGEDAVDASALGAGKIIFKDCDEVLDGHYAIESYADGRSRTIVGEPVIGETIASDAAATEADEDAAEMMTVKAWTKHEKKWLAKGDKLASRMSRVRTLQQARKALGTFQRHLRTETKWLRKNKDRFEPDTCLADDMIKWQSRVRQAQKSLNKAVTALNRGNAVAVSRNMRQFLRAYTKIEQVYRVGMCDF